MTFAQIVNRSNKQSLKCAVAENGSLQRRSLKCHSLRCRRIALVAHDNFVSASWINCTIYKTWCTSTSLPLSKIDRSLLRPCSQLWPASRRPSGLGWGPPTTFCPGLTVRLWHTETSRAGAPGPRGPRMWSRWVQWLVGSGTDSRRASRLNKRGRDEACHCTASRLQLHR